MKQLIGYVPENAVMYDVLTPTEYFRFLGSLYQKEGEAVEKKGDELLRIFGLYNHRDDRMTFFLQGHEAEGTAYIGYAAQPRHYLF